MCVMDVICTGTWRTQRGFAGDINPGVRSLQGKGEGGIEGSSKRAELEGGTSSVSFFQMERRKKGKKCPGEGRK